jgi:lysyl-tRNA synthetase class 2
MGREEQIINEKKRKLIELGKMRINPYAYKFDVKDYSSEIKDKYKKLKNNQKTKDKATIAGRVMTIRDLGKLIFSTIQDSQGKIQIILQKEETEKNSFELFKKYIDAGDFVGCEGIIMKTKTGEVSVLIKKLELLTKSILPLPEKFHGIQDKEERYRKRYLDLIMNPEIKDIFKKRSRIIEALREFLIKKEFLEVDTPVLQPIPGGAIAKPFVTKYNAYDTDVYMRIAPELYLKRLLVGGFDKVFEFSRCFRNEGVDWSHNPEFTNLEFYQAYIEYNELMKLTEELIIDVVKKINGKPEIERNNKKIKIKRPFKKITFEKLTKGEMSDEAFKEEIKKIKEPTFVINHPLDMSPLAKKNDNKTVQRFQLIIDGIEIVNAFSELNDPLDQEERFIEQSKKKGEKHEQDKEFIEALKYGMPPAAGFGMGIDRFVMLMTGKDSLREILLFPFMKPEEKKEIKEMVEKKIEMEKEEK